LFLRALSKNLGEPSMQALVRAVAACVVVLPALAQPALPQERNVVITKGADYFGADYDVRQDVELEACQAACLGDQHCQAFTYNSAARWCFLKSDVGELRAVEGAVSGRVVAAAEVRPDVEAERVAELSFLSQPYFDEARHFLGQIMEEEGDRTMEEALAAAEGFRATNNWVGGARAYRDAIRLAPERYDLWASYTELTNRLGGAINAYLRAVTTDERAEALAMIGRSLDARGDYRKSIRAYRASLALREDPAHRRIYVTLAREHGFGIVDHVVDADSAAPRICLTFSDPLAETRGDLADFVSIEGGTNLAVEAEGNQLCLEGVEHGRRYRLTVREGLPAADGDSLAESAALSFFVRDRAPMVRFLGDAYVLPAGGEPAIPVVTVNATRIEAELHRIGDRLLARTLAEGTFLQALSEWEAEDIESSRGEKVWEGSVDIASEMNREVTTAIPVGELEDRLEPGAYILTAKTMNDREDWAPHATQWFVVTDLGLTTLSGNDGLHVMVRSLTTAGTVGGVGLRLVAINNEVLGEVVTDAEGYASFPPGLMRGTGGMAPGLLVAETAAGDYSFLDMSRAPMDLTDRGVEGREPPKPLDVFLTTERGIYRTGETVYATALVRDATAEAVTGVPLTAIVTRPDGKEHSRATLADQRLGGSVTPVNLPGNAMRGAWRIAVHADVEGEPLAQTTFLVEDFNPERLDFDLTSPSPAIAPGAPATVGVEARFLYGAPASNLELQGETRLNPARSLAAYPGYIFGLEDDPFRTVSEPFSGATTDETGHATIEAALPGVADVSVPLEAMVTVRVLDTSGRPVERSLTLPVLGERSRLGIRPLFTGAASDNSEVAFELIAVGPQGERLSDQEVGWALYKVDPTFQWYRSDGRWGYERIETTRRIANGTVAIGGDQPTRVRAPVEWGTYRLVVESAGDVLPASFEFEAGWYVEPTALDTPEALKVSLDKERYAVGQMARVHLETRFDGIALVMVVDDRLVATSTVEVQGNTADIEIPVTRAWGPGAYVTAFLYRPMDLQAKRMPARAVGLAWAGVDPAGRKLNVEIAAPQEMRPRQTLDVEVQLANLPAGTEAVVTLAAVDLGILNLTRYETPDPEAYYFGRRRLGVAIRDLYNSLIDRMQGARGIVRSGGDASPVTQFAGPPPMESLLAFHSGIVEVGENGTARIGVPIPDFNGTVRLMALAWSKEGVGHAEKDVLVRDPVVLTASLPRFLAPGDRSRLALDATAFGETTGTVALAIRSTGAAVSVEPAFAERNLELAAGLREQILVPVSGERVGNDVITVTMTLPDGEVLEKTLPIAVRMNEPPVANTTFVELAPGGSLAVTGDALEGLVPGTASVQVSASGAGRLNVPAILRALDRYPYGCTEQITSRAMPLVYLDDVAIQAGLEGDPDIHDRVEKAIAGVLANQAANGSFGLWRPGGEDFWLDAYVTDFLTRAKARGFDVPAESFALALENLQNRLAYAGDFQSGGESIAYGLYVLAANGRAAIGDLRYYVETKLDAFTTPLARAQLGAALALYGDKVRAELAFRAALGDLEVPRDDYAGWRDDYGSPLRDGAAILTLASETRTDIDLISLSRRVERGRVNARYTSTQEDAWSLMAAHALMQSLARPELAVDGEPLEGPLFRGVDAESLARAPVSVENRGDRPIPVGITVRGVPAAPEPAGGNFYQLSRSYYTLDGKPVELSAVAQGERLVTVLDVTTNEMAGARLVLDDPLPAGFEIDNPHLLSSGDVAALDWLNLIDEPAHVEFRADRFVAAWELGLNSGTRFQFAYIVRAVSPGQFLHPAAIVEDMYRPERRARTDTGRVEVVGPLR
jgi:uncharacterized protein YfaS (alpha-2-macroglobulin family)